MEDRGSATFTFPLDPTLDLGSVDAALAKCRRVEAACEHTSGCPDLAATLARAHDLLGLPERAGVVETLAIACDQVAMRRGEVDVLRSALATLRRRLSR